MSTAAIESKDHNFQLYMSSSIRFEKHEEDRRSREDNPTESHRREYLPRAANQVSGSGGCDMILLSIFWFVTNPFIHQSILVTAIPIQDPCVPV